MNKIEIKSINNGFDIEIDSIAPDKSISHRCAIFSLLSDEPSTIYNYLKAEDTLNTLMIIESLGAKIEEVENKMVITPPKQIQEPSYFLNCGNSGTAIRLLAGFLSSQDGLFILDGDKYLRERPMKRIVNPLKEIGSKIDGRKNGDLAPLVIRGEKLKPFNYESKIASAQIKSTMILAGLKASGISKYKEPELSRDHTERMLNGMGCNIKKDDNNYIIIEPLKNKLKPLNLQVPADPSSSFFFAVATAITPNAKCLIKNVTLNPTRIEAFVILKKMGVKIEFIEKENIYEPIGDINIEYNELNSIEISDNISWLIDELPALSIAMACANGKSIVKNAEELRVKESDRIKNIVNNLIKCGIEVKEFENGYEIIGGELKSAIIDSSGDHRIAMSFAIAGLRCDMQINDINCINTSFPNFIKLLKNITKVNI